MPAGFYFAGLGLLAAWAWAMGCNWEDAYWMDECYAGNVSAEDCRGHFGWSN